VAECCARICEGFASRGHKLPVISIWMERKFQGSERIYVSSLAIWLYTRNRSVVCSTGTDNEFSNPAQRVCYTIGILRSKTLVNMVVTIQNNLYIVVIQKRVNLLHIRIGASAGREYGNMVIDQRTDIWVILKILLEPDILRTTSAASTGLAALRIESNNMPGTNIVTVIALATISSWTVRVSDTIPIIEIINGIRYQIFVVTSNGVRDREESSPGRSIVIIKTVGGRRMAQVTHNQSCIRHLIYYNLRRCHLLTSR